MKKHIIFLIIGSILLLLGFYQNTQYEEHSLTVTAVITDIKTRDTTGDGPVSYKHTYYGDYTVDGKQYTNKELITQYDGSSHPKYHTGDTIDVKVSPENPGRKVSDGGFCMVGGLILTIIGGVGLHKSKKSTKNTNPAAQEISQ